MFSLTWFFVWFTVWEKTHELIESSLYSQSPPPEIFFSSNETPTEWCMPVFVVTVAGSSTPNISQYTSHSYLVRGSHPAPPLILHSLFSQSVSPFFLSSSPLGLLLWCLHLCQTPRPCVFPKSSPGCGWGDLGFNRLLWLPILGLSTNKVLIFRFPSLSPEPLLEPITQVVPSSCSLMEFSTIHALGTYMAFVLCDITHNIQS